MNTIEEIIAYIRAQIYSNGTQRITGNYLQDVLVNVADALEQIHTTDIGTVRALISAVNAAKANKNGNPAETFAALSLTVEDIIRGKSVVGETVAGDKFTLHNSENNALTDIVPGAQTEDVELVAPSKSGTLALQEDVDAAVSPLGQKVNGKQGYDVDLDVAVTAGTGISRNTHHAFDNILKAGHTYKISATGLSNVATIAIYFYQSDNSTSATGIWDGSGSPTGSASFTTQVPSRTFTPGSDVYYWAIYLQAAAATTTGTVTFNIHEEGIVGLDEKITTVQSETVALVKKVDNTLKQTVTLASSNVTSQKVTGTFPIGTVVMLKVEMVGTAAITQARLYDQSGYTNLRVMVTNGEWVYVTLTRAATELYFYIASGYISTTGSAVLYISVPCVVYDTQKNADGILQLDRAVSNDVSGTIALTAGTNSPSTAMRLVRGDFKEGDIVTVNVSTADATVAEVSVYSMPQTLIGTIPASKFGTDVDIALTADGSYIGLFAAAADITVGGTLSYTIKAPSLDKRIRENAARIDNVEQLAETPDPVDRVAMKTENPLDKISRNVGFAAMFLNWGFIGDSLSSGSINTEEDYDETFRTKLYDYSWGQYLCRLCGTQGYNFSRGGWSAKNWLEASGSHAGRGWAGAKANPKDVYAIAFGVNDRVQYSAGDADTDIGSYDATTDTDTNAATFAGYYAGIIQRIQSIQPKAKIFVITLPQGDAGDQGEFADFNVVIRAMATKFSNVYIVDLWNYAPTFSGGWNTRYRHVYHLTAQGYLWFAWCFAEYVDWIVRSNWADFKDVELIGSEYTLEIR